MCSTTVMSAVQAEIGRRNFLRTVGGAAVGIGAAVLEERAELQRDGPASDERIVRFGKVVDCTHVLEPDVPNYFRLNMEIAPLLTLEQNGAYVNRLTVPEH